MTKLRLLKAGGQQLSRAWMQWPGRLLTTKTFVSTSAPVFVTCPLNSKNPPTPTGVAGQTSETRKLGAVSNGQTCVAVSATRVPAQRS